MKWRLTRKQAGSLFKGGQAELDTNISKGLGGLVWESTNDPESGKATLAIDSSDTKRPFRLAGEGRHHEDLLELAGIVLVARKLAEALYFGNAQSLDTLIAAARGDGTGVVDRIEVQSMGGASIDLMVAQDGKTLYVELP